MFIFIFMDIYIPTTGKLFQADSHGSFHGDVARRASFVEIWVFSSEKEGRRKSANEDISVMASLAEE